MPSSDVVGCQSIGRMRSSNWEDVRNFHFLMIVHKMAIPPTDAAMTMSTIKVVRVILDDDPEAVAGVVGEALDACVVTVTWALVGVATTGESVTAVIDGRDVLDKDELDDDNDEDVLEKEELELALELEVVCVTKLGRLLGKGVLVEDDDEAEAEAAGALEVAGVFLEEVAASDEEVVDCVVAPAADAVLELVGGSAPAPLAGSALPLPPVKSPPACGEGARFLIRRLRLT